MARHPLLRKRRVGCPKYLGLGTLLLTKARCKYLYGICSEEAVSDEESGCDEGGGVGCCASETGIVFVTIFEIYVTFC